MKQVAILISGRGSNMEALCQAAETTDSAYQVCRVLSNRPDAKGLQWASDHGFSTRVVDHRKFTSKAEFEAELNDDLNTAGADFVCLAGFMRLLSANFVQKWRGRLLNIHPSLLPSFPGLVPQQQALDAGVRISGCTVHFVSEDMDAGPIIVQTAVPVLPQDSEATLSKRILTAEHRTYAPALAAVCAGRVFWDGGSKATMSDEAGEPLHHYLDI
uniref:phosphoribosylglycinamide formyltransferase n=1 Tax=Pararhizobium sp. IMCC3301 TaxID=3067904 RepID=UPI0027426584|nr:phosphoribosylglycinamide formyltransferase [Pararhizobium sp. IMCC3301]